MITLVAIAAAAAVVCVPLPDPTGRVVCRLDKDRRLAVFVDGKPAPTQSLPRRAAE